MFVCSEMALYKTVHSKVKGLKYRKHGTDIKSDQQSINLWWRCLSLRMDSDSSLCAFVYHSSVVSTLTDVKDRKSVWSKQTLASQPTPSDCTCSWSLSIKHVPENLLPQKAIKEVYNWHLTPQLDNTQRQHVICHCRLAVWHSGVVQGQNASKTIQT